MEKQDILAKHEEAGTTGSGEYQFAMLAYIERFVCRTKPMPEDVLIGVKLLEEDPTVYHTMCVSRALLPVLRVT